MTDAVEGTAARVAALAVLVEERVDRVLPAVDGPEGEAFAASRLIDSMRDSVRTPGKRLRPLLVLGAAQAAGAEPAGLATFAVGVEMIHAYSLIHDDLPAMDDDDLRRGQPTNHVVYGDGMAILAGDALLTEAFVAMLEPVSLSCEGATGPQRIEPGLQMRVVREVARAAGYEGMVGGQAADLLAEGREPLEDLLRSIHQRKTGALIRASVRAGAQLAGAPADTQDSLDEFAAHYGLAFQIADDVKDEVAPTEVTGKRRGGDKDAGKMTYPALLGIEGSRARCAEELQRAVASLAPLGARAAALELIARESVAPAFADNGA